MTFYEFVRKVLCVVFHTVRRVRVYDIENVPTDKAVLIAPNHIGLLDPFMVSYKYSRKINWMAKKELFKVGIVRKFITYMGAFPVDREKKDTSQARTIFRLLANGEPVGIFPEGTRARKNKPRPVPKAGVIKYAIETNTPIVPVAIWGDSRVFGKMNVRYGKPFYIPQKENGEHYERSEILSMSKKLVENIYAMQEIPCGDN